MENKKKRSTMTIYTNEGLEQRLDEISKEKEISKSQVIREAVKELHKKLDDQKKKEDK